MNLDSQQQAAVETTSRRALVIAGAGSGKTRVLISRIAHLLENCQVSPHEVMGFTFTRKAACEMRERLEAAIVSRSRQVTLGTMHALALQMLRKFGEVIGLKPYNITVYSEWEEAFLLKEVAGEMGIFKKSWKIPKKDVDAVFADYYERGQEPDKDNPVSPLFRTFLARCRENNSLTYGMLLHALERLIPTMARYLHIKHVLVDEVQDIDPMQWRIINGMCEAFGASLFAVGDLRQSIYKFRGAVPEYLLEHQEDFQIYELQSNYRSVPAVVEAANNLMNHSLAFLGSGMLATRESLDGGYEVQQWMHADSARLAAEMSLYRSTTYNDTAILARNHVLLKRLDQELTACEIPHTYVGRKTALTNSEEFRRFHAFLKLIENPYDNFSFLLIRDLIGLGPKDYANYRYEAAREGQSHFQAWYTCENGFNVYADNFFEAVKSHGGLASAAFLIKYMATGATPFPDAAGWSFDVDPVFQFVMAWLADHPTGTITEYLDWLATWDIQEEVKSEPEGITLSTIHGAKGLEWPVVIVAGCNEGLLPSRQAVANGGIEEEVRLAYVAITRARDQLILAVRPERKEYPDGRVIESPVSRFVGWAIA